MEATRLAARRGRLVRGRGGGGARGDAEAGAHKGARVLVAERRARTVVEDAAGAAGRDADAQVEANAHVRRRLGRGRAAALPLRAARERCLPCGRAAGDALADLLAPVGSRAGDELHAQPRLIVVGVDRRDELALARVADDAIDRDAVDAHARRSAARPQRCRRGASRGRGRCGCRSTATT